MAEKNQAPAAGTASFGGRASRLIPIGLLCILALAVVVNQIRGKQDQSLDGVVVMDYPRYTFYVGQKDCYPQGAPYLLMPSQNFHDVAATPGAGEINHLDELFHGTWRVRLRGNLSPIGRYGSQGNYWRKVDVLYVIDAVQLDCTNEKAKVSP